MSKLTRVVVATPAVSVTFIGDGLSRISDRIDFQDLVIYLTIHFVGCATVNNFVCFEDKNPDCSVITFDIVIIGFSTLEIADR